MGIYWKTRVANLSLFSISQRPDNFGKRNAVDTDSFFGIGFWKKPNGYEIRLYPGWYQRTSRCQIQRAGVCDGLQFLKFGYGGKCGKCDLDIWLEVIICHKVIAGVTGRISYSNKEWSVSWRMCIDPPDKLRYAISGRPREGIIPFTGIFWNNE